MLRSTTKVFVPTLFVALLVPLGSSVAQTSRDVTGRVRVLEREDRLARDVGQAVVWLEADGAEAAAPDTVQVLTAGKEFRPRVVVVPLGSTIEFPNTDPFNHNVFSLSREAPFDLGLFGRGEEKSTSFDRPGIVRIYCNVHAQMSAFVVVRENPYYTQPSADGSFSIPNVPPGNYTLHAWHERAAEPVTEDVVVGGAGELAALDIALDASRYQFVQHKNKYGRPYRRGRRY